MLVIAQVCDKAVKRSTSLAGETPQEKRRRCPAESRLNGGCQLFMGDVSDLMWPFSFLRGRRDREGGELWGAWMWSGWGTHTLTHTSAKLISEHEIVERLRWNYPAATIHQAIWSVAHSIPYIKKKFVYKMFTFFLWWLYGIMNIVWLVCS